MTPRERGKQDYRNNKRLVDNPYRNSYGTDDFVDWEEGWHEENRKKN